MIERHRTVRSELLVVNLESFCRTVCSTMHSESRPPHGNRFKVACTCVPRTVNVK